MSQRATGSFDVKVTPQKPDTQIARAANLSRLTIDKRFHGDLEGIGKGEMLALQTDTKGSAGYVALERVTATLKGRQGSSPLPESGTTAITACCSPRFMVPECCSTKLPWRPLRVAVTRSSAT